MVTRDATELHAELRSLFFELVGLSSPARILIPSEVKRVSDMCIGMLGQVAGAPGWFADEGKAALLAGQRANDLRNRYVHDELFAAGQPDRWVRQRHGTLSSPGLKATEFELSELAQCSDDLHRAAWRTSGIAMCTGDIIRKDSVSDHREAHRKMMRGEFVFVMHDPPYRGIRLLED